jgi:hypothetical protein
MSELFQEYDRITFTVKAATVSPLNIEELATVTGGKLMHDGPKEGNFSRDYIRIDDVVHPRSDRQKQAFIGDVIVMQGRTFRIYPAGQFRQQFKLKDSITMPVKTHPKPAQKQGKRKGPRVAARPQAAPNPANMPKKRTPDRFERLDKITEDFQEKEVLEGNAAVVADKPIEIASPEAAAVRRHEELSENGVTDGQTPGAETPDEIAYADMAGREIIEQEIDATERILQTSFGETAEHAASRRLIEEKALAEAAATPKPITLDELEQRPGDPRTATEINLGE